MMLMISRRAHSFYSLLLLIFALPAAAVQSQSPLELIRDTADQVLAEVVSKKLELARAPGRIYGLVEDKVLPGFDFTRMSRLVLGKYWQRATPVQKSAFETAFRELLVRTYATVLLNYSDQAITYLPMRQSEDASHVTVATLVNNSTAPSVPINYKLYLKQEEWKVYDVIIDGVSLITNYRSSFNAQIRRYELDGLIRNLEKRNMRGK